MELNTKNIMIIGDLIARIGEEQTVELSGIRKSRSSSDKVINAKGLALLNLLQVYNLRIVNGTTKSDQNGEFTFLNRNGQSVIDLCCIGG